jgi:hypothetical protein
MNPQEKKAASYARDRRNSYGQSHGGSLKGIRRHKHVEARVGRRLAHQLLGQVRNEPETDLSEDARINSRPVKRWEKYADQPLGLLLAQQSSRSIEFYSRTYAARVPTLLLELSSELAIAGIHRRQIDEICSVLRSKQDAPCSASLDLPLEIARTTWKCLRVVFSRHSIEPLARRSAPSNQEA